MIEYSKNETLRIRMEQGDSLLDVIQVITCHIGDDDLEDAFEGFLFRAIESDDTIVLTREGKMEKIS